MKSEQEYIKDLSEIRLMMERSTKFLSLSGLSGIMAGVYALVGAYIAYQLYFVNAVTAYETDNPSVSGTIFDLVAIGLFVLLLAVGTAIYLSYRKAKKYKHVLWNAAARSLVIHMAIPLVTGGMLIAIIISQEIFTLIAPFTLIFYGLALINASKFTFTEIRYLGITEIAIGLISAYFTGFGLIFWAIGFGLMHIVYGVLMHWRYER